jgi:hephaestin
MIPPLCVYIRTVCDGYPVNSCLICSVAKSETDHISAGMMALVNVSASSGEPSGISSANSSGKGDREYFIQAEDVVWDYAPQGLDVCDDRQFEDEENTFVLADRPIRDEQEAVIGYSIGSKYLKTRYFQYTDDSFSKRAPSTKLGDHLGVMGPVIRAQVGDEIVVYFRSNSSEPVSLHPHGVTYKKSSEGAPYNDGTSGTDKIDDMLKSGESHVYRWVVSPRAGPGPGEAGDTKLWMYHSHRNEIMDTYAGLFGALLIVSSDAETYNEQDLMPNDDTKEIILHFSVMNEGLSVHMPRNVRRNNNNSKLSQKRVDDLGANEDFVESNLMHSINGFVYCNGPVFTAQVGQLIRVHMYSLGTEVDLHSPVFGNEVMNLSTGSSRSSGKLLPGSFFAADVRPMRAGKDELRCNVNDHVLAGMRALFSIQPSRTPAGNYLEQAFDSDMGRVHYVAAEEIEWDYAESGMDKCTDEPLGEEAEVFTAPGKCKPGSKYVKSVYREYDGADFQRRVRTTAYAPKFDGLLGPLFHFEVGDIVRIVFRNNLSFAANINIAGLELLSPASPNFAVPPGSETTFVWRVSSSAGPSRADLSSVPYVYFSSVDSIRHVHAGLVGVVGIAAAGALGDHKYRPRDVAVVHPIMFNVIRENQSPFIAESVRRFGEGKCGPDDLERLNTDEEWIESNAMHSTNGYSFCNNPLFEAIYGRKVRFYVFGFGSEESMHAPVFHNQIIGREVRRGESASGVQIFPYNAEAVDVLMVARGRNVFECAVADHVLAGMKGRYLVR